jgi:Protein of unknown function (DUF1569)
MPSLRDQTARRQLVQRLQKLTPATRPKWGKLNAPGVLCHLSDTLAVALGDASATPLNRKLLHHFPVKHLIIHVFPFPKGALTAPEYLSSSPGDFDTDRRRLLELMDRLAAARKATGPENPIFGPMTNDEWNVLQWKHFDHHLKQFGC